jgi:endonuclease III
MTWQVLVMLVLADKTTDVTVAKSTKTVKERTTAPNGWTAHKI